MSSTNSRNRDTRTAGAFGSMPAAAGPAVGSPTPRATSTRPPDGWSTVTAALAASTGERKKRLVTSVPMRIDVYKAIAASVVGPSKSVVL
jgi:hypothetical protein